MEKLCLYARKEINFAITSKQKSLNCCNLRFIFFLISVVERNGSSSPLETFLAALNAFTMSCAEDCRGQVCHLGESLFPLLLQMWKKPQQSSSTFKVLQRILSLILNPCRHTCCRLKWISGQILSTLTSTCVMINFPLSLPH